MKITFRNYDPEPFFTGDYVKVREFLAHINSKNLNEFRMPWGAWEWAVTHGGRDQNNLGKIGLWEDDNKIVALATYECPLGEAFLIVNEAYALLKPEVIAYAKKALCDENGKLRMLLKDGDYEFARAARAQGLRPTQKKDYNAVLDIATMDAYTLPEGFYFSSMADGWDWQQYNRVMARGFRGEENPEWNDEIESTRRQMLSSHMINAELVLAVVAPDGSYVSHCGMWYKPGEFYCYVEPVATDPAYRKMGLGKAAVLEAVRRCGELGAKLALVGSNQQFYYNIGFNPAQTMTYWELV